ncbi:hypothetical protein DSI31_00675, partial [Mycobacterium tuberculosis]
MRTELVRDAVGRLVEKRTATHHYRYRYNALDQLIDAVRLEVVGPQAEGKPAQLRALHRNCFAYDRLGRLVGETAIDEVTGERHQLRHEHDALGNRTCTLLPALGGQDDALRALNYLHY